MSRLAKDSHDLHGILKAKDKVFVLFYASWCPFSIRFLPIFERLAQAEEENFVRIVIDREEGLCEKYAVAVYPTVIFFEKGNISRRLDGLAGIGLDEEKLAELISACKA